MITSVEEYIRLFNSDLPEDYSRITRDTIPDDLCFQLITQFPKYRQWVACNRYVSLEILRILAKDEDYKVRWEVAQRANVDDKILDLLSSDPDEGVRHRVVINPKTPLHILERLAQDEWEVCATSAKKKLAERRGQKP